MSRDQLVAATRRNLVHSRNGTVPLDAGIKRVPVLNYYDPQRWQLEMDRVFRRLPLVLGFSCEMREPHSYKALDVMGTPVLLTRGDDGVVRSFVNMCSHRGAIVVEEGTGTGRRFACPYHAWTYDQRGELVGMLDKANFGEIDMSCHGLTPLPVAERAGIIFGGITPGMPFDIDAFLCGYDSMLEHIGLADCTFVGRQMVEGPNWKLAYDGYLDFYHLPILHKDTFGSTYNNKTINDAWGPHQRNVQPDERILALADIPEDEWPMSKLTGGVWTIFPHVSVAAFDAGGRMFMISQLFPGDTPETSVTVQKLPRHVRTRRRAAQHDRQADGFPHARRARRGLLHRQAHPAGSEDRCQDRVRLRSQRGSVSAVPWLGRRPRCCAGCGCHGGLVR